MSPRIHVSARDHTTPVYHPVQERETIAPMERGEHPVVSLAIWSLVVASIVLTWVMLP